MQRCEIVFAPYSCNFQRKSHAFKSHRKFGISGKTETRLRSESVRVHRRSVSAAVRKILLTRISKRWELCEKSSERGRERERERERASKGSQKMEFLWRLAIPCRREKWLPKLSYPLSSFSPVSPPFPCSSSLQNYFSRSDSRHGSPSHSSSLLVAFVFSSWLSCSARIEKGGLRRNVSGRGGPPLEAARAKKRR